MFKHLLGIALFQDFSVVHKDHMICHTFAKAISWVTMIIVVF